MWEGESKEGSVGKEGKKMKIVKVPHFFACDFPLRTEH